MRTQEVTYGTPLPELHRTSTAWPFQPIRVDRQELPGLTAACVSDGPSYPSDRYGRGMQVQTATFKALVQGEKQFQVPIWQRQYTWKAEQHDQLWHDLMEQYRLVTAGETEISGHFLGQLRAVPEGSDGRAGSPTSWSSTASSG